MGTLLTFHDHPQRCCRQQLIEPRRGEAGGLTPNRNTVRQDQPPAPPAPLEFFGLVGVMVLVYLAFAGIYLWGIGLS